MKPDLYHEANPVKDTGNLNSKSTFLDVFIEFTEDGIFDEAPFIFVDTFSSVPFPVSHPANKRDMRDTNIITLMINAPCFRQQSFYFPLKFEELL